MTAMFTDYSIKASSRLKFPIELGECTGQLEKKIKTSEIVQNIIQSFLPYLSLT